MAYAHQLPRAAHACALGGDETAFSPMCGVATTDSGPCRKQRFDFSIFMTRAADVNSQ